MEANRGGHSMDHEGPMKSDMNMKMAMKGTVKAMGHPFPDLVRAVF